LFFAPLVLAALFPVGGAATSRATSPAQLLFLSPSGSDAGRCTRGEPCAGFDRAYAIARPRAIVSVAGGTYREQIINARSGRSRPRVIFRPAAGAKVVVAALKVFASHLELRDLALNDLELPRDADDVVFRHIHNRGVFMQGPSNISFIGGEITCRVCDYHSHLDDGGAPDYRPPRNIVFDGVYFHDWQSAAGEHTECLQILAGDHITIRNSVFKNCATANGGRGATANLHIAWLGNGPMTRNVLLENNFFYPSGNTYAIQMNDYANLDLRYNSISGPIMVFDREGPGTGMDFVGNVMRFSGCGAEGSSVAINWRYNVMEGGTCSSTDRNAGSQFVDPRNNLHLKPGAVAIDRGDPQSYPRQDIDGTRRPRGGRPDSGADEAR
jgi:hypothetical protein